MDHFLYRDGQLFAEDVPLAQIAAEVGTPFYAYSTATLTRHFRLFDEALDGMPHLICFAMKSLSNQAVLRVLAQAGAGMDVVSEGEYRRAIAAGVSGDKIVFSGVGKTAGEMRVALEGGIRQFNVESEAEMIVLSAVAEEMGVVAPITIRVNPDVDAKTHAKIATGKSENKFGIPISRAREVYKMAADLAGLKVVGIDVHIGSQLTDLAPFEAAYLKVADSAAPPAAVAQDAPVRRPRRKKTDWVEEAKIAAAACDSVEALKAAIVAFEGSPLKSASENTSLGIPAVDPATATF